MPDDVEHVDANPRSDAAAAAARLVAGAGGAPGLVEAIQARLDTMIGRPSGFLDDLPRATRARVRFLQSLQTEYDELEEAHKKEADELDRKYAALYAPLLSKRASVVKGDLEAPADIVEATPAGDDDSEPAPPGIPQFWLGALRAHDLLANQITDKDEAVLVHLMDVRCDDLEGDDAHGFRLTFEFEPNDFFEGTTLAMTYHMDPDDDGMLERVEGTAIPWKAGKDPTVKKMKRKAKPGRGGRGGAPAAPQYKIESVDSFFHWFAPPVVPDGDGSASESEVEALQAALEESFEVAETLRDEVVPNAVSFFTGDAVAESEEEDEEEGEDDDDGEGSDDDGGDGSSHSDDSDGDGGRPAPRGRKAPAPPTDAAGDKPAECKQQ